MAETVFCVDVAARLAPTTRSRAASQRGGHVQQAPVRRSASARAQGHSHREVHTRASANGKDAETATADANVVSRRSMMSLLLATSFVQPALADDDDKDVADMEALVKAVMEKQPGISGSHREKTVLRERELSFEAPNTWSLPEGTVTTSGTDEDGFDYTSWPGQVDPVNGLVLDEVRLLIRPTDKLSIEDFGKPEKINFSEAYGISSLGFPRADVLGVTIRKDASGGVFYDWDLAVPPLVCPKSSQFGNISCESESVVFVSSTISNGYLSLFTARLSSRRQWEVNGIALKRVRTTFVNADPPPAVVPGPVTTVPLPDPTPGAGISIVVAAP